MDSLHRTAERLKSERRGGEAEADGGMIMGVATNSPTTAMPATFASRTWIIDTGAAQHLIEKTSSRVESEIGCLGGLKVNPLVMDSSPCVLSAGLLVAAGFGLTWAPEALELTLPNGCKATLRSRRNVPGIVESNATALTTRGKQASSSKFLCCGKASHLCSTLIASDPRFRSYHVIEEMDGDDVDTLNQA
eukprot:1990885-Amphidinium_carterae.1